MLKFSMAMGSMYHLKLAAFAIALQAVAAAKPAAAASIVLDVNNLIVGQAYEGYGSRAIPGFNENSSFFQTFKVGTTGYLSSIDIFSSAVDLFATNSTFANVKMEIFAEGTQDQPGTMSFGVIQKSFGEMLGSPKINTFYLRSLNVFSVAGETLTFRITVDPCAPGTRTTCNRTFTTWNYLIDGNTNNYGEGAGVMDFGNRVLVFGDSNFRTFVDADVLPVPEPATWVMMLIGFVGLGSVMRQIRRKRTYFA